MSMLKIHRSALEEVIVPYSEFLSAQNNAKKQIFGFVEGKDDPSYYQGHIENCISNDEWTLKLIEAGKPKGNRDRVLRLLNLIDWRRYSIKQTVFFIDRDLSEFSAFIKEDELPEAENLYVTEMYAIENYIVSKHTLKRALREIYNISLQDYELAIIYTLFEEGVNYIKELMSSIISWYLYLRSNDCKPSFDSIDMNDLIIIERCKVQPKITDLNAYIKVKWGIEDKNVDLAPILKEFNDKDGQNKFVRGKNLMWFFIAFINSFCKTCDKIIPSIQSPITGCRELSIKDAVKDLGPRTKIPESLKAFLDRTCVVYIQEKEIGTA